MPDGITIPRSFAGSIGIADVMTSMRRRYLNIPLAITSGTGVAWGGNGTTGLTFLQRPIKLEKLYCSLYNTTTIGNSTHVLLRLYKDASTAITLTLTAATTLSQRYIAGSASPTITDVAAGSKLRLRMPTRNAKSVRIAVTLVYLEDTDA